MTDKPWIENKFGAQKTCPKLSVKMMFTNLQTFFFSDSFGMLQVSFFFVFAFACCMLCVAVAFVAVAAAAGVVADGVAVAVL